jgi:hypothetical protein
MNGNEYIICSAIHFDDGKEYIHQPKNIKNGFVICGHRHHNCFMTIKILREKRIDFQEAKETQGFLTNKNIFLTREEAMEIAKSNGQISADLKNKELFSEDLY